MEAMSHPLENVVKMVLRILFVERIMSRGKCGERHLKRAIYLKITDPLE